MDCGHSNPSNESSIVPKTSTSPSCSCSVEASNRCLRSLILATVSWKFVTLRHLEHFTFSFSPTVSEVPQCEHLRTCIANKSCLRVEKIKIKIEKKQLIKLKNFVKVTVEVFFRFAWLIFKFLKFLGESCFIGNIKAK